MAKPATANDRTKPIRYSIAASLLLSLTRSSRQAEEDRKAPP